MERGEGACGKEVGACEKGVGGLWKKGVGGLWKGGRALFYDKNVAKSIQNKHLYIHVPILAYKAY